MVRLPQRARVLYTFFTNTSVIIIIIAYDVRYVVNNIIKRGPDRYISGDPAKILGTAYRVYILHPDAILVYTHIIMCIILLRMYV